MAPIFLTSPFRRLGCGRGPLPIPRLAVCLLVLVGSGVAASPGTEELREHVTIYRDHYGVPHIVGDSETATFFGYGYAQAEDHLEEMMIQYRDAQGRRSEILGPGALGKELHFVPYQYRWGGDYLQRLLRTWQTVEDNKWKIEPDVYKILDAFAQGVNSYIREHRDEIPSWIDGISAVDIEALERSNYLRFYSIDDALSKLPGPFTSSYPNLGSNQWAIARDKSADGHILHVEHIHMPWGGRLQNYEAHLITPGVLDVAGISWFGSPFFLVGFNPSITWSITWNQPNLGDAYEERLNPANQRQYLYEGQWRDIKIDWATFHVKSAAGRMETVKLPMYYTHHGPIVRIDRQQNRAYSIKVSNLDGVNYSTGLYSLMKADSVGAFRAALARQLIPRWNFLCTSDTQIYWVHNAIVAQRDPSFDWSKPVPGWKRATEWGPYLPFTSNPQLLNPASSFVQNCNNPPWLATRYSRMNPLEPAAYYLKSGVRLSAYDAVRCVLGLRSGEEALNARGERVFDLLSQPRKFTLSEMFSMVFDTHVMASDVIVPLLDRAAGNRKLPADPRLSRAVELLNNWNRRSSADSVAFTYLYYWAKAYRDLYSESSFRRFIGPSRNKIDISSPSEQDKAWLALEKAVNLLQQRFGTSEVAWGRINLVRRGGDYPLGGTGLFDVLHPDDGPEQPDGKILCNDGWGHAMVVLESKPKRIWTLLPYGESEHAASPHFGDQALLHSQQKLKPFPFTRDEILAYTESVWGDPDRLRHCPESSLVRVPAYGR